MKPRYAYGACATVGCGHASNPTKPNGRGTGHFQRGTGACKVKGCQCPRYERPQT